MASKGVTLLLLAVVCVTLVLAEDEDLKFRKRRQANGPPGQRRRPGGQSGQRPSGPPGRRGPGQQGQGPNGQRGQRPGGQQGQRPGGQQGQRPGGQQGQRPGGQQGQRPGGQQGQRPSGQQGQRPGGQQGGQQGQRPGGQGPMTNQASVPEPENVLELATSYAKDGICHTPGYTCNGNRCGNDLESVYNEQIVGNNRLIITNGVPKHQYGEGAEKKNPNEVCIHHAYMQVPLNPIKGVYIGSGMGPVGIAFSGAFFYNHLSSPDGSVAVVQEQISFDNCNGHADGMCRYHYHKIPNCLTPADSCEKVGYMRDGFPVYSHCLRNGVRLRSCYKKIDGETGDKQTHYTYEKTDDCHLDEANGYDFEDGTYGYVFSENYPFVMRGYMGSNISEICEVY